LSLDAIIISDSGTNSLSGTNPLKLKIDGKTASIQMILNYLKHQGRIEPPIEGDDTMSWSSAFQLNGIYLLSHLTRNNFKAAVIRGFYEEKDSFCHLLEENPRMVIISTTFIFSKQALSRLIEDIRSLAPDIFIVVGGPFVYLSYLMLKKSADPGYDTDSARDDFLFLDVNSEPAADLYIISLRGEQILCEVLDRVKNNKSLGHMPNTARLKGKTYEFQSRIDDITDSGSFHVDWDCLPDDIFKSGVVPMQASAGCPYKCAFCNFTKDRRLTFVKPLDEIINELKAVKKRGVRYVWFVDDNFRLGSPDLNEVCRRFIDEDLNLRWMSFVRAGTLKNVDIELLRRAGCIEVQLGLESADTQMLRNMNKKARPAMYASVIPELLAAGINCSCYFIFGFPGETRETISRTCDFIQSIEHPELDGLLSWSIFPFILSPLSPIYESANRQPYGLKGYLHKWEHATMNSEEAKAHVLEAFLNLKNSGPIYRTDNQDILSDLTPSKRHQFEALRHSLAKAALKNPLEFSKVDISIFERIF